LLGLLEAAGAKGPDSPSAFFNSLSYNLSCDGEKRRNAQFSEIQTAVKINNALSNLDLLVICGLCKLNPQCKPIHVRHIDHAQSQARQHTARRAIGTGRPQTGDWPHRGAT